VTIEYGKKKSKFAGMAVEPKKLHYPYASQF